MRRSAILCPVACLALVAVSSRGDTLYLPDNGKMQGNLRELLLRVNDVPRVYPRDEIRAAHLSESGDDCLFLADGGRVQGRVLSVTFECGDKLYALGRSKVRCVSVEARGATAVARPAALLAPPSGSEAPKVHRPFTAEELRCQGNALRKNDQLCEKYLAQAGKRGLLGSASKAEERRQRVLAMAEQIKLELQAGRPLTEGQMAVRYEAALAGKAFSEPTKARMRTMTSGGVRLLPGSGKDAPELVVEPFPEENY